MNLCWLVVACQSFQACTTDGACIGVSREPRKCPEEWLTVPHLPPPPGLWEGFPSFRWKGYCHWRTKGDEMAGRRYPSFLLLLEQITTSLAARNNANLLSYSSVIQKYEMALTGLELRCWQGRLHSFLKTLGENLFSFQLLDTVRVFIFFIYGPFLHLQSQQGSISLIRLSHCQIFLWLSSAFFFH